MAIVFALQGEMLRYLNEAASASLRSLAPTFVPSYEGITYLYFQLPVFYLRVSVPCMVNIFVVKFENSDLALRILSRARCLPSAYH